MAARVQRDERRIGRRGMALVLVLVFGVASLTLVLTMLSLSDAGAKVEGSRHHDKTLHALARYGLVSAVNEVNRARAAGPYDPTGNGPGCILVGPDGKRGWPVTDRSGRVLGRFTTMVKTKTLDDGLRRRTLEVVVVDGEFPLDWATAQKRLQVATARVDASRELVLPLNVVTAELELSTTGMSFDRNALSIRGPAGANGAKGFYYDPKALQVHIHGNEVPAVNISDAEMHAKFVADPAISKWGSVTGLDPETNSAATTRPATVTSKQSGLLNQETLTQVATGIDARVATILATGTPITNANATLPEGNYYIDSKLLVDSGQTLTGSGTLVINKGVDIKNKLNWTGEVIIANNDAAQVNIKGELNVKGILAIQGYGTATNMGVTVESGGKVNVGTATDAGAFTILGDANTANPLKFKNGANGATVNGIFTIMGDQLSMSFDTGAKIHVNGSLALITPVDAPTGVNIMFRSGAHATLNYTAKSFDGAIKRLGAFFDADGSSTPIVIRAYLEAPETREELFQGHLEADPTGNYGME